MRMAAEPGPESPSARADGSGPVEVGAPAGRAWLAAPCTRGTACHRCSTTTPGTCRRASSPPSPASTQPTCAAARAGAGILTAVSASAARRHPAGLPTAMAAYITRALSREAAA